MNNNTSATMNVDKIKNLKDFPVVSMTSDQTRALLITQLSDSEEFKKEFTEAQSVEFGFLAQVFYNRLKRHGLKIELGLAVFLLTTMTTPGQAVLWVWTLFNFPKKEMHTMTEWINEFPMGIPSEASYEKAWDAQKDQISGGNLLDNPKTWVQ